MTMFVADWWLLSRESACCRGLMWRGERRTTVPATLAVCSMLDFMNWRCQYFLRVMWP